MHLAVHDTPADWEFDYAIAHIANPMWQAESGRFAVATVADGPDPVTSAGAVRILPDTTLMRCAPPTARC